MTPREFIGQANRDSLVITELLTAHRAMVLLHHAHLQIGTNGAVVNLQREIEALQRALRLLGLDQAGLGERIASGA